MTIKYSVVIPLYNEEENVQDLIEELVPVMEKVGEPWELLCIDDGSSDSTRLILNKLKNNHPYLKPLLFTKNFGQSSAFDAGFKAAKGEFVITMDGDRQNDPADIPSLIEEAKKGYDLICGRRKKRRDSLVKKLTSFFANAVRSRVCRDGMSDTGCSLKVYRRQSLQSIKMFEGMHRFLPALFTIEGYRCSEVNVNHRERVKGVSKYNFFNRSFNTIFDMLAVVWMRRRHLHYSIKKDSQ